MPAGGHVTSRDVARLAGVSQPTVSRALRDDPRVTEETKTRVREAARALGYVPSELGRGLSTRAARQIAIVTDLDNAIYSSLVAPIHDELASRGYRMLLLAARGDDGAHYQRLFDRSVDGAILTTSRLQSALPYDLAQRKVPFVLLNRTSDLVDAPSIVADNAGGAALVAELFLQHGYRKVGAVVGPQDTSTGREREGSFRQALSEAGVALPARWTSHGPFTHESGDAGMTEVMSQRSRPEAVFCANDLLAIGALNAAARLGLRVPDDVAVVGFDDLPEAAWPVFQLTTVHNPLGEMARAAARLLVDLVEGGSGPGGPEVFPTALVLRRTHAVLPS